MRTAVLVILLDIAASLEKWQDRTVDVDSEAFIVFAIGFIFALAQDIKELSQ